MEQPAAGHTSNQLEVAILSRRRGRGWTRRRRRNCDSGCHSGWLLVFGGFQVSSLARAFFKLVFAAVARLPGPLWAIGSRSTAGTTAGCRVWGAPAAAAEQQGVKHAGMLMHIAGCRILPNVRCVHKGRRAGAGQGVWTASGNMEACGLGTCLEKQRRQASATTHNEGGDARQAGRSIWS